MKRRLLLPLVILCGSIGSLQAQSFFTSTPQFLTPANRNTANTEFSYWDLFYNPYNGINYPDMAAPNGFGGYASQTPGAVVPPGSNPSDPFAFWHTSNPTLKQTIPGAIIAQVNAASNIYSFTNSTAYEIEDTTPFNAKSINFQWATNGQLFDTSTLQLVIVVGQNTISLSPTNFIQEFKDSPTEFGLGFFNRASAQWDLSAYSNITSYKILIQTAGPHSSLEEIQLDTSATYSVVTPTTRVYSGGGGNNLWNTAANWVGSAIPMSAGNVSIGSGSGLEIATANTTVSELRISAPGSFVLSRSGNGTLKLNTGITTTPSSPANYVISTPIVMGSFNIFNLNANTDLTISNTISGNTGFMKEGPGTLRLTANNTFTGRMVIDGGNTYVSGTNSHSGDTSVFSGNLVVQIHTPASGTGALGSDPKIDVGNGGDATSPSASVLAEGPISIGKEFQISAGAGSKILGGMNTGTGATFSGTITLDATASDVSLYAASASDRVTFTGNITGGPGGGTIHKTGTGTVVFSNTNKTYGSQTNVAAGTLEIANGNTLSNTGTVTVRAGATLRVHGSLAGAGTLVLDGGTLSGRGTINRTFTLDNGDTLSPGDAVGIGTINTLGQFWDGGGRLRLEITDGLGVAGTSWDFINLTGALDLTGIGSDHFTLELDSLLGGVSGKMDNFNTDLNYSWKFLTASGGITGFDSGLFAFELNEFMNGSAGVFSVTNVGNDLFLNYTAVPEPSAALYLLSGSVLLLRRRRSRKP